MTRPKLLKPFVILFLFCLGNFVLTSQTPCSGGMAGSYPCDGIDLMSHLSPSALGNPTDGGGNDIWGWTHPTTGTEYALVGLLNGTAFVDISTPSVPAIIGFLPSHTAGNDTWRDIKVANGHAYIVSEATGHGVQIFDLENLNISPPGTPITFTEDGWIDLPGNIDDAHNIVALEEKNLIYPVGTHGSCSGGITTYDVTNPTNPTWVDCFSSDGYSHDAMCFIYRGPDTDHTGKEICIGFNENTFTIIDMENGSIIKRQSYGGSEYTHQGWVTDDQKYLLFDDELDEGNGATTTTFIYDISNLDVPFEKYVYESSVNATDHNQYVKGPYVYQANYTAGLRILDISDLDNTAPTEVAYFDIYPSNNGPSGNGAWSVYPYYDSGLVVIDGIGSAGGLFVVEPQLPHNVISTQGTGVDTTCAGEAVVFTLDNKAFSGMTSSDNLTVSGLPSGVTATFGVNPIPINTTTTLTINNTGSLAVGNYSFMVTGTEIPVNRIALSFVVGALPGASTNIFPPNGATDLEANILFTWASSSNTTSYDVQVAFDPFFLIIDYSATDLTTTSTNLFIPEPGETLWWRVLSKNDCETVVSSTRTNFGISGDAVPIELVKLQATPKDQAILLVWQTASELDNTGFQLERTTNPKNIDFEKIGWIVSKNGNGTTLQDYAYSDQNVTAGITYYYRLKQIDTDGQFSYSPIVSASLERKSPVVIAFPNPATNQLSLQLDGANFFRGKAELTIYDLTGQLLLVENVELTSLIAPYILDISNLAKGIYILRLSNEQLNLPIRFVKL